MEFTKRQRETLIDLHSAARYAATPDHAWVRPMDLGGRDESHHSKTLRWLCKHGYAERRLRSGRPVESRVRPAYVYRISDVGEREAERLLGPPTPARLPSPELRAP